MSARQQATRLTRLYGHLLPSLAVPAAVVRELKHFVWDTPVLKINYALDSPAGRSRTQVGRLLCNRAWAPQVGHQPTPAVVSIAHSTSPSPSETANTAMPANPSIAVALVFSLTWGLPVRVP